MHPEELLKIQADTAADPDAVAEKTAADAFSRLGRRSRRVDGHRKATGSEVYTDDIVLPGMLHGKILRSPHPHARIVAIDTSAAEAMDGVHGVITGRDMPTAYGIIPWTRDEHALALDKVRFIGDAVAAVAAVDEDTANEALKAIVVEYEILPPIFEPEEALEETEHPIHAPTKPGRNGNVTKYVHLEFGEVDDAMAGSEVTVEGEYYFHGTTHTPIEPHCAVGRLNANGLLEVWSSTQVPHYLHRELARVLEWDVAEIRVVQPAVGGAFGGKSEPFDLEFAVALLAIRTGRPVKILYTREEVFYSHRGRHPMEMAYRVGATKDGRIRAVALLAIRTGRPVKILYTREEVFYSHRGRHPMEMAYRVGATKDGRIRAVDGKLLLDGGAYASFGLVTAYYSGQLLMAPYDVETYRFDATRVYTNKPPCGPKRGHGSVQPRFGFEISLDKLAVKLGLDPIELRRRNFMGLGRTVNEFRVQSNGFLECLEKVEAASEWKARYGKLPRGQGLGIAGSCYISGTNYPIYPNDMPQASAQVQIERSGRVTVLHGASEIGQGSDSTMAYIACEELGVPLEYVRVISADTDLTPVDLGAYSSRETLMVGNAVLMACRELKAKIVASVARSAEVEPESVRLAEGWAFAGGATGNGDGKRMPIAAAFMLAEAEHGTLGAVGHYNTPKEGVHGDYRGGTIGASPAYSFTAHVAEVEVDEDTGFVDVKKIWVAHDCGKALNPMLVEGQIEGSAYMGFAEALMEEQTVKRGTPEGGLHNAPSLLDYRIPTSLDCPEFIAMIVEANDPEGPYGAKEAGEGPLHPSLPAIANAIYDAVGVRIDRLPFTPDRVWRALQEARERAAEAKAG